MKINFVTGILSDAKLEIIAGDFFRKDLPPGSASWSQSEPDLIDGILYVCPCGCGRVDTVPVSLGGTDPRPWKWDGNLELPTLTPSIRKLGGCRWHGFLTAGDWRTC